MPKKILVSGSIAYDLLLKHEGSFPEAIDPANLDTLSVVYVAEHFAKHHGGCAANVAWYLRMLGQESLMIGTVGSDGGPYLALLEERGIDTKHVEVLKTKMTATAIVATDNAEHQITFYHPGADAAGKFPDVADDREDIAYALISPRATRVMMEGVEWCRSHKVKYIFDPGQMVPALSEEELIHAIDKAAGVVVNAYEWALLSKRTAYSVDMVLEHAPFLVVTQAEEGVTVYGRKETIVIPACKADKVVNPTGAGDAFRAAFTTGLAAKWPLLHCARFGASLASFVVEQEGTMLDALDVEEVWARAQATYGEALPELS